MPSILEGYCSKSPQPREVAEKEAEQFLKIIEDSSSYQFGYNHSVAYCLLGYLCAYYRHYYPLEFLTSFLNNAANDDDIKNGTVYARQIGADVTMPKWGVSRSEYFFDKEKFIIAKGLSSIKFLNTKVADELYELAHEKTYDCFVDLLYDLENRTSINSRQLEILIKIDFFSEFGNQRELFRIVELFYDVFNCGNAKKILKERISGTPLEDVVKKYATGVTKTGGEAKSYTLLDVYSILADAEKIIKQSNMEDISDLIKVKNFEEIMGYAGYVTDKEEDRRKLYVLNVYPLVRHSDGKQFGYNILTKSIGSGKESSLTVYNRTYDKDPIHKGEIIFCTDCDRNGKYFRLNSYYHIY